MNIILRVPKGERRHVIEYKCEGPSAWAWWTLGCTPKFAKPGDLVIFQHDGQLIAEAPIHYVGAGGHLARLCPEDFASADECPAHVVVWEPARATVYDEPRLGKPAAGQWAWRYEQAR